MVCDWMSCVFKGREITTLLQKSFPSLCASNSVTKTIYIGNMKGLFGPESLTDLCSKHKEM